MNDSRDIGDMGELHFNAWCAEVGLIANKATKDKMGWDFIVEFPFSNEISGSHVHQSASKCKVQVKATDGQKRKLSVSLTNLRKLAVDPYPCSYIFIEYDGNNLPSNAFLRHVDSDKEKATLSGLFFIYPNKPDVSIFSRYLVNPLYSAKYAQVEYNTVYTNAIINPCLSK